MHREQLEAAGQDAKSLTNREMTIAKQPAAHMKRSRQMRRPERRARAAAIEHFDFEVVVKHEILCRTDAAEEVQRLGVAAHQDVLTVVDEVTALGVRK